MTDGYSVASLRARFDKEQEQTRQIKDAQNAKDRENRAKAAAERDRLFKERGFKTVSNIKKRFELNTKEPRLKHYRQKASSARMRQAMWVSLDNTVYEAYVWVLNRRSRTDMNQLSVLIEFYRQAGKASPKNSANYAIRKMEAAGCWFRGTAGGERVSYPVPQFCAHYEPQSIEEELPEMLTRHMGMLRLMGRGVRNADARNFQAGTGSATLLCRLFVEHRESFRPGQELTKRERQGLAEAAAMLHRIGIPTRYWRNYLNWCSGFLQRAGKDGSLLAWGLSDALAIRFQEALGRDEPIDYPHLANMVIDDLETSGAFEGMGIDEALDLENDVCRLLGEMVLDQQVDRVDEDETIAFAREAIERAWTKVQPGFANLNFYWFHRVKEGDIVPRMREVVTVEIGDWMSRRKGQVANGARMSERREKNGTKFVYPNNLDFQRPIFEQLGY